MMTEPVPTVVAISRQLGAGGTELGSRVAKRLGFLYLDREILTRAAAELDLPERDLECWEERSSRFWERMAQAMSMGPPEGVYSPTTVMPLAIDRRVYDIESRIIRDVARHQNAVIIGRCAGWILRRHPGLIRIFLHAPPSARARTIQQLFDLKDEAAARRLIQDVDRERERFVRQTNGADVWDARQHDLCICTDSIDMDLAEEMVVQLIQHRQALSPSPLQGEGRGEGRPSLSK